MAKDRLAKEKGLAAMIMIGEGGMLRMKLDGDAGDPATVALKFIHPSTSNRDVEFELKNIGGGFYTSSEGIEDQSVNWNVLITPPEEKWRLRGRWKPLTQKSITIQPK